MNMINTEEKRLINVIKKEFTCITINTNWIILYLIAKCAINTTKLENVHGNIR